MFQKLALYNKKFAQKLNLWGKGNHNNWILSLPEECKVNETNVFGLYI